MGRAYSTHGEEKSQNESDHHADADVDVGEKIILTWISERKSGVVRTGLIWLGIGTGGGLL
jgi:hypothetical protein